MKTFLISYDLGVPESHADYAALFEKLKDLYSAWSRPVKSVWIVKSEKTATQIRDEIKLLLDQNDKLIVVELGTNWGTYNVSKTVTDWMKNNI